MVNELVPKMNRAESIDEIVRRWENFTFGILKSPAIRRELRHRQNAQCALCGKKIEPAEEHIHHTSYIYLCYTSMNVDSIPPCTQCERKDGCLSRLRIMHGNCHEEIHSDKNEQPVAPIANEAIDKVKVRYPRSKAPWTAEDIAMLKVLLTSKKRMSSIAIALGRSPRAVKLYIKRSDFVEDAKI